MKIQASDLKDDDPVPLRMAPDLFFPLGGVSLAILRKQARAGRLDVERIGKTEFVTRRAIQQMRARCHDKRSPPASGSEETEAEDADGSSSTETSISAQDALRIRLQTPKPPSRATSRRSESRAPTPVVQLRPTSGTS